MSLVLNFEAFTSLPNQNALRWDQPYNFNDESREIIITKTITHFPMELYNEDFPDTATDSRPIEIYRAGVIVGLDPSTVSVVDNVLTDTSASLPVSPSLKGRLLRDSISRVFRIASNTATTITVEDSVDESGTTIYPTAGRYTVLTDFTQEDRIQQNFEVDLRTSASHSRISNLVESIDGNLEDVVFTPGELANLIFRDGFGDRYIIANNSTDTIYFFQRPIISNTNLIEFTYDTITGIVAYSSAIDLSNVNTKLSFDNSSLLTFSYNSTTGEIQYNVAADLDSVRAEDIFLDSSGTEFVITSVNYAAKKVVIATGQTVDTTNPTLPIHGSIRQTDVFKDSSGNTFAIFGVDDGADELTISTGQTVDTSIPENFRHGEIIIKEVPIVQTEMRIYNSHVDTSPEPYIDNFLTEAEADARTGTGLLDNQFYYYTAFTKEIGVNVAQARFSIVDSGTSTQVSALSTKDRNMGTVLYRLWPSLYRDLDSTGDLQDLMLVFGSQFREIHSLIETYRLQDEHTVFVNALLPLSEQTGLPAVGFSIGIDTLRRIAKDWLSASKLKGTKEGLVMFIRIITTWDITGGTGNISDAIEDYLPNVEALRLFDQNLGTANTRITTTDPFLAGGRFAESIPGIVIPGFFQIREFIIKVPNVALFIGTSESFSTGPGTTTMTDSAQNFGPDDSLIGNFLIPNLEEIDDVFLITGNTATTITVAGSINNQTPEGEYAILSPLNSNRLAILNKLMPVYIPFGTRASYEFIV